MTPLVPSSVDLRDFAFMPMEFGRLFASDTWTLSNDAEKVAAITLWGKSWAQVPAGSLPDDDRLLAVHSGAGQRWKRVKDMALRGWRKADDGRLYHPVVSEKALEAWLEKLSSRLSSGAGNAKRWGIEFDPAAIEADIREARAFLVRLNPQSRTLLKKKPPGIPSGSKKPPVGNADGIPPGIPTGSQETGTGTGTKKQEHSVGSFEARSEDPESARAPDPNAMVVGQNLVVRACTLMRQAGIPATRMNPSHAELIAGIREGATPEQYRDTAIEAINAGKDSPFVWTIATVRKRNAQAAREPSTARAGPEAKSKTRRAIENLDRIISHAEQPENGLDTRRIGPGNAETALPPPPGAAAGRRS